MNREQTEQRICAAICQGNGLKAKDIARQLNLDRSMVNRVLYASPLLKDLCYQDDSYRWHGIIRQSVPHDGLFEFSGYYAKVSDFLKLTEDEWMDELTKGCQRIGRNLNDTRGLLHSFRDCREQMINLFADLQDMLGDSFLDWEIVFEFRLKRGRYVRIYADVLVITENKVFSLEFKMKDKLAQAICSSTCLTSIWDFCQTVIITINCSPVRRCSCLHERRHKPAAFGYCLSLSAS